MSERYHEASVFSADEGHLIRAITRALHASGDAHDLVLERTVQDAIDRLKRLALLMVDYPSLLERQTLGQQKRDSASLIHTLAHATLFTVDMILPMRAMVGQTYVMARLNFFRLLRHVAREALAEWTEFPRVNAAIEQRISQSIYAKVVESLLIAIVCDDSLGTAVRTKSARALIALWEDRLSSRVEAFFPVLRATWEARRKITVQFGTLMGVSEIFALMREGGDPRFIDYFSRMTCTEEEIQAFREFLFGLSTESLETLIQKGNCPDSTLPSDRSSLQAYPVTDFATQLYMFFVKRHLEALTRRVSQIAGPKRTAEEYVMIHFLEQDGRSFL